MAASLDEVQCAYLRTLLFEELEKAAQALAELAACAAHGNADRENIAGDDAHGALHNRVLVTAELLDTIGWSVLDDTALLVECEQAGVS